MMKLWTFFWIITTGFFFFFGGGGGGGGGWRGSLILYIYFLGLFLKVKVQNWNIFGGAIC